jgi:hypothetical protein
MQNGHGSTVNTYHVIAIQPVFWCVSRIYSKHGFLYCCALDRVYRAVAWKCAYQIPYNIKHYATRMQIYNIFIINKQLNYLSSVNRHLGN